MLWVIRAAAIGVACGALGIVGCFESGGPTWEIVADNQSDVTCTVSVELAGGSYTETSVENLAPGKRHVLLSGTSKVVVRVVRRKRKGEVQELKRNIEVPVGKRFLIVVNEDGLLNTSLAEK